MNREVEQMSDSELTAVLKRYHRRSQLLIIGGIIAMFAGLVVFLTVKAKPLGPMIASVLSAGGFCCALFLGGRAQSKLKRVINEQFGSFMKDEYRKRFGEDCQTPGMEINKQLIDKFHIREGEWEELDISERHEGEYKGIHFAAANLRLYHVCRRGSPNDGYEKINKTVYEGIVIRISPYSGIPEGIAAISDGNVLTTVTESNIRIAELPENSDPRDLKSYLKSLDELVRVLELTMK